MQLMNLWIYVDELFINADYETELLKENISVDVSSLKNLWLKKTTEIF